jgi:hypothetical protein
VFREFYGISLPTREDNELARRLPPEVLLAVQRYYCPGGVWAGTRITCSPENIHINSARVAGKYILLHANHGAIDGSRGLVYSPSRRCVVGMFVWFIEA